jgi:dienelactone hydrolase
MAPDTTNTSQATAMSMQGRAIDWIHENAGKGKYTNVDATRLMTAGFSCGGLEAAYNLNDERVATVGIVSSGLKDEDKKYLASTWKKPVLYVLGGPTDPPLENVSCPLPFCTTDLYSL